MPINQAMNVNAAKSNAMAKPPAIDVVASASIASTPRMLEWSMPVSQSATPQHHETPVETNRAVIGLLSDYLLK